MRGKTSYRMKSSFGFIFSTDALLSVLIVFFFVGAIAYFSAQTYADYSLLDLERKASDTLAVLHKQGYLADQNSTLITSVINGITGNNVGWQLEVKYYQKSGQNFVLNKTLILGQNDSNAKSEIVVDRPFIVTMENSTYLYGKARLKEWVG